MSQDKTTRPAPHPFAFTDPRNGANDMRAGDRFIYTIDGRAGWADEFLSDGEAFVTWDDGSHGTIKWNHMVPETEWAGVSHSMMEAHVGRR